MRKGGFTLLELLVALSLLVVALGLLARSLIAQAAVARLTEARSEAQDKARLVMSLVAQDLELAGSRHLVREDLTTASPGNGTPCPTAPCLVATNGGIRDGLAVSYATSLRAEADACRRVEYRFVALELQRSEVGCGQQSAHATVAAGVIGLDVVYLCGDGTTVHTLAPGCPAAPRSARVTVVAVSQDVLIGHRDPRAYPLLTGGACPAERVCFALEQEVFMPNLARSRAAS